MSESLRIGARVRELRRRAGLSQVQLAERIGVSASYVNLIEHNHRPVTAALLLKLARQLQVDLTQLAADSEERLAQDLMEVFSDSLFAEHPLTNQDVQDFVGSHAAVASAVRTLFAAYQQTRDGMAELAGQDTDGALDADESRGAGLLSAGRLPTEEVSDFLQARRNHFPELEAAAEALSRDASLEREGLHAGLLSWLEKKLQVDVHVARLAEEPHALRRYDPLRRQLSLSEVLPPRSRNFQLAAQVALLQHGDLMDSLIAAAPILASAASRDLARVALANYFAGAVLMPYRLFLQAARQERYDIELLGHRFRTSIEQTCHRLTTLSRPGEEGVPFHLVRVDIAGNISKKFSATGIRFARFGAACSLWNVFQAFVAPGRIIVQVSEMPDGAAFFCFATTVPKGRGGYHSPHTVHAIGMGTTLEAAKELVYADGMDLQRIERVPIGVTCRLCPRMDCAQRAFPPLRTELSVDPNVRGLSLFAPVKHP